MKRSDFRTITLGYIAELEAHVRIPSNRSTGRWGVHRSELAAMQQKMQWQTTAAHPNAPRFWGFPVDIQENHTAKIGDQEANRYFSQNNGFMMLKVAVENVAGNLALPMSFSKEKTKGTLWYADPDENPRDDGRTGYSIPVHNLVPAHLPGRHFYFFFVLLIEGDMENAHARLYKINVTRGKEFYTIKEEMVYTTYSAVKDIVKNIHAENEDFERLPLEEAVEQYATRFQ